MGAPYFNHFFIPVGLALLFLMAVAPALPWRKSTLEVMRGRLVVPAAMGVIVVTICVLAGVHGLEPLLAFGLATFAGGSAGRALVLSVRGAYRAARSNGASPARSALDGWRGLVGRANGGMVVHIGVVVVAIGLAAATSFLHRGELQLAKGESATFAGHHITFVDTRQINSASRSSFQAVLRVDHGTFYPAVSQFGSGTQAVGTPAIDSSWRNDLYLTIDNIPTSGVVWSFGVVEQPLVMWLWVGAILIGVGSILSAIPGRRRRPTDPVSKPVVARSARPTQPVRPGTDAAPGDHPDPDETVAGKPDTVTVRAGDPT